MGNKNVKHFTTKPKGKSLSRVQFVKLAYDKIRHSWTKDGQTHTAQGIWCGRTGFTNAYSQFFGVDKDTAIAEVNRMVELQLIDGHPMSGRGNAKGDFVIYPKGMMAQAKKQNNAEATLKAMGLNTLR